jgi:hypothetical protein
VTRLTARNAATPTNAPDRSRRRSVIATLQGVGFASSDPDGRPIHSGHLHLMLLSGEVLNSGTIKLGFNTVPATTRATG